MKKPLFSIAIALVTRSDRWLVAMRPAHAHMGGKWEFPGGKIEPGESAIEAALRELREECHVVARAEGSLPCRMYEYPDRRVELHPVICRWQSGEAQPVENQECRWVSLEELARLSMPPANASIIADIPRVYPGND